MIKFIRTNDKNYFIDENGNRVDKFDPASNLSLIITMDDGSVLKVDNSQIYQQIDGQIIVNYSSDRYLIDDGYQDNLIGSGYIILNNYDTEHIVDAEIGVKTRNQFYDYINKCAKLFSDPEYEIDQVFTAKNNQNIFIKFHNSEFDYTCSIDTINNIVTKNQIRIKESLPLFQFVKDMDKYGTMYVSMFCKRREDAPDVNHKKKYYYGNHFIRKFVDSLNDRIDDNNGDKYKFVKVINKRHLNSLNDCT